MHTGISKGLDLRNILMLKKKRKACLSTGETQHYLLAFSPALSPSCNLLLNTLE